jgi:hypothetical protein
MAHIIYPFQAQSHRRSSFYKFLSSLLIASFLLPASALAQATEPLASEGSPATSSSSVDTTSAADQSSQTTTPPADPHGTNSLLSGEDETVYDESREPKEKKPKAESNIQTGALNYSYPIKTPPGRNGLHPDLELRYSSQDGTTDNLFGYGWSTNIPYIERINRKGIEKLYTENFFTSSLDGELLLTSVSTTTDYKAKVQNGDFRTYTFANNQWTVTDKRGTTYKFGTTTGSRQDDVAGSTRIYKWMLDEIRDPNGNFIKYEYYKNDGQIYPSKIIYTGNGSTDGIFETEFVRESRTDVASSTKPGFNVKTNYRISEIQTKVNGSWVRKYVLLYTTGDNGSRSLLQTIRESGRDEQTNTITLPDATSFQQSSTKKWATSTTWTIPEYIVGSSYEDLGVRFADVNGDGFIDLLRSYGAGSTFSQKVYINNRDNTGWTYASSSWAIPNADLYFGEQDTGTRLADLNGDALPDIIKAQAIGGSSYTQKVFLNTGSGWAEETTWSFPAGFSFVEGAVFADVNGDGLADVVQSFIIDTSSFKNIYLNTGSGFATSSGWTIPEYMRL